MAMVEATAAGTTASTPGVGERDERHMSDQQLRRRYRTVMALMQVPPANELAGDDLNLHASAIEIEAARRGLDLHAVEEQRPSRGLCTTDLVAAGLLALFGTLIVFAWASSWTP